MLGLSAWLSPVWYDDAGHFIVVRHLVETGTLAYPLNSITGEAAESSPFITMGPALNYPAAAWMHIFGTKMIAARLLIILSTIAFLSIFWGFARYLLDKQKAFWALLLVGGNIQLLTYGAEFLGELPMLCWLFAGLWMLMKAINSPKLNWAMIGGSVVAFLLAVLTKEYILVMIGLGILIGFVSQAIQKQQIPARTLFSLGAGVLVGYLGFHLIRTGMGAETLNWFTDRLSYSSEFFAADFRESMRFLVRKPLIWLGGIALLIRIRVRKEQNDKLLGLFFLCQLLLFLVSAGYDRFGFQLLFIPAIYLAEFMLAAWRKIREHKLKWLGLPVFVGVFLLLFTQQTGVIFTQRLLHPEQTNETEKCTVEWLKAHNKASIFTFDQQLIPFLPPEITYRLPHLVPSQANIVQQNPFGRSYYLSGEDAFVEGTYGRSEYLGLLATDAVTWTDSLQCGVPPWGYTIFIPEYNSNVKIPPGGYGK